MTGPYVLSLAMADRPKIRLEARWYGLLGLTSTRPQILSTSVRASRYDHYPLGSKLLDSPGRIESEPIK